ncbi:unnamed protein product [Cuscuta epithymum]|uniref:ribonuclease P n=2 Tax=Cuscuta epithymum TaxID=186058 RepID=A0AAV0FR34_9ASTE|nr:unnamed protein product [Cuscuta epithymum]
MNSSGDNQQCKKKRKALTPETQFRLALDQCSKSKDLKAAISLYDSAVSKPSSIRMSNHHFNSFLYICSNAVSKPETKQSAIEFGLRVYENMVSGGASPNEATATSVARLVAANNDGDTAFELAKGVGNGGKLRTYGPALFCFCRNGEADQAYQVEEQMESIGLQLEEPELCALFKVSVEKENQANVYNYLHKLRKAVRGVSEMTAEIIEGWFRGEVASMSGLLKWDANQVKEMLVRNGGGWHGLGWLGKGKWAVQRTSIASDGQCLTCSEQLVCVDIAREETETFAYSVSSLAMERESQSNFKEFQDWLESHSEFEAVVDGANIGLYQQNFAEGGFSASQLIAVVNHLHNRSNKWPLVVLHKKRVRALLESANHREVIEKWINEGVLYPTPYGSNDDWYWLFAAVKLQCFLVTNDEMRDHIFELFGSNFFIRWKERHQVRYTFVKGNPSLSLPPSFSIVIQESEKGSWHVPLASETVDESTSAWLCITRPYCKDSNEKVQYNLETSETCEIRRCDQFLDSKQNSDACNGISNSPVLIAGKRKDRS